MNNDIDDIFSDVMEEKIKKEVQNKRKKLNIKLILAAVVLSLITIIAGNIGLNVASNWYIGKSFSKDKEEKELEYVIKYPNEYIGKETCREIGYFKYESTFDVAKRIGSKVIFAGPLTDSSGVIGSKKYNDKESWTISSIPLSEDINKRYSSVYGLRKLHFLYPYVKYGKEVYEYETEKNKVSRESLDEGKENIINDFHFLNEINDNKIVEMALSFDKEYTYDEVNKMLDSNLITFYWVDNNSEEEKKHDEELSSPAFNIVGIKSTDMAGEYKDNIDERMKNFKWALEELKNIGNTQYVKNIDENNIKIIGAVVVGKPKELKAIQNNSMIKHAVIGTVVDEY